MIKSYTIGSLVQFPSLDDLERIQFTLNSHMRPYRRHASEMITRVVQEYPNFPELFVHEDYIRTIPRFPLLKQDYKSEMIIETFQLLSHPKVKGMVIHMDSPFPQSMIAKSHDDINVFIDLVKSLNSQMYVGYNEILTILTTLPEIKTVNDLIGAYYRLSVDMFYVALDSYAKHRNKNISELSPLYLENTTKVPLRDATIKPGSVMHNAILSTAHPDLYGVCYDTEHAYAIGDVVPSPDYILSLREINPRILVHLNTIEKGVQQGNYLDRHSMTAIDACQVHDYKHYLLFAKWLDAHGIPYLREVKSTVMQYELAFQKTLQESYPQVYSEIYGNNN